MIEPLNAIGRRKTSVASVFLKKGKGNISINKRTLTDYFPFVNHQNVVNDPFIVTETKEQFDVRVRVSGGGINGQAEAVRLAISRALCKVNAENKPKLKSKGYLTRDSRMVERKKSGLKKARKASQFSKR